MPKVLETGIEDNTENIIDKTDKKTSLEVANIVKNMYLNHVVVSLIHISIK